MGILAGTRGEHRSFSSLCLSLTAHPRVHWTACSEPRSLHLRLPFVLREAAHGCLDLESEALEADSVLAHGYFPSLSSGFLFCKMGTVMIRWLRVFDEKA